MLDTLLSHLAPHPCYLCAKLGKPLCDDCKYDIASEQYIGCLQCGRATGAEGACRDCRLPYLRGWCVGERTGALQDLLDDYKFNRKKANAAVITELIDYILPDVPADTVIVPVPTIAPHIRQRGYDHTGLIARALAKRRGITVQPTLLRRKTRTVQREAATRRQRIAQAKAAFFVADSLSETVPYLLIDDIVTSGATIRYAAKALRTAGAHMVWVAVAARQPLD